MKKSLLALSLITFLSTAAFSMDADEKLQENTQSLPKARLTLGQINPSTQDITTLDDLAQYAHNSGDLFYFNTTSGRTQGGGSATDIDIIQKWNKNFIVGLVNNNGNPVKAVISKSHITSAYVDWRGM